jgi:hypothetical protein
MDHLLHGPRRRRHGAAGRIACAAALLALAGLFPFVVTPGAAARTALAELRVEGPDGTLDPGTWYVTGTESIKRSGSSDSCPRRTGTIRVPGPTAMGLPQTASAANPKLRQVRIRRDEAGLFMCEIGSVLGRPFTDPAGFSGWSYWQDYVAGTSSADLVKLRGGDRILWVFSDFGAATPLNTGDALELQSVDPGTTDGELEVRVTAHAFDGASAPATGATIDGAEAVQELGGGRYSVTVGQGSTTLEATRGLDIPSQPLATCFEKQASDCPKARGKTIVGSRAGDRLEGTKGWDQIDSGGGDDQIDIRGGGRDRINCGGGRDTVIRKRGAGGAQIASSCERVRRR